MEWKTRSKTRAKSSASTLSAKSQKRSHHDRNEIVGAVNSIESAKPVSSTEEKKVQFDTIRKNDISIPARIALDTTEKSVKKKKIDRNIKITNILILGDLIIPLGLGLTADPEEWGIVFVILIAFPLLIILLIARSIQGGNRRKIFKNKNAIHDDREQIELWARQVAKGKITEEEFGQRVSEI